MPLTSPVPAWGYWEFWRNSQMCSRVGFREEGNLIRSTDQPDCVQILALAWTSHMTSDKFPTFSVSALVLLWSGRNNSTSLVGLSWGQGSSHAGWHFSAAWPEASKVHVSPWFVSSGSCRTQRWKSVPFCDITRQNNSLTTCGFLVAQSCPTLLQLHGL